MAEVSNVDTSIGCGTNNNTTKKAKDMVVGDHILIRDTPCEVKNIARDSTGWLVITGLMLFHKNGRRTMTCRPEEDCEVPHVSRANYICTAIYRNEYVILESKHDSGPRATRSDVRLPPDQLMGELELVESSPMAPRKPVETLEDVRQERSELKRELAKVKAENEDLKSQIQHLTRQLRDSKNDLKRETQIAEGAQALLLAMGDELKKSVPTTVSQEGVVTICQITYSVNEQIPTRREGGPEFYIGECEKRPSMVKVCSWDVIADEEYRKYVRLDEGQNIVRCFGMSIDGEKMYMGFEICVCTLGELVVFCGRKESAMTNYPLTPNQTTLISTTMGDKKLWVGDNKASPLLIYLMRGLLSRIAYLHKKGLAHRDLNPHNILINSSFTTKISDLRECKEPQSKGPRNGKKHFKLEKERAAIMIFHFLVLGPRNLGWKPREMILMESETYGVDVFSFGCVLFFCLTKGDNPFGYLEENIKEGKWNLAKLRDNHEAKSLISACLNTNPKDR